MIETFKEKYDIADSKGLGSIIRTIKQSKSPTPFLFNDLKNLEEIGERLKSIREDKGVSIKELAKKLNIHVRTIQYMEKGERMKFDLLLKYLKFFGFELAFWNESEEKLLIREK